MGVRTWERAPSFPARQEGTEDLWHVQTAVAGIAARETRPLMMCFHAGISLFNHVWDKKYSSPRRRAAHRDAGRGRRSGGASGIRVILCRLIRAPGPSLSARRPHPCGSGLEPCGVEDLLHPRPESPAGSQSPPDLTFKPSGPQRPRRPLLNPDEPPPSPLAVHVCAVSRRCD